MQSKHNKQLVPLAKQLRKEMTKEERHLWYDFLKNYPIRFLRQKVIDNYIVDFYCHSARLIIELDGSQHYEEKGLLKDRIRTERIEKRNLTVMRIPNNEVNRNFEGVCQYIDNIVKESLRQSATDTSCESPSHLRRQPPLGKGAVKISKFAKTVFCYARNILKRWNQI